MRSENKPPIRAVLDTNILVSALCFPGGSPDLVFRAAVHKKYEMITCQFILNEFSRVLKNKFGFSGEEAARAVNVVKSAAHQTVQPLNVPEIITAKPQDNYILACALEAGADYLVTGDKKHIRPLGSIGKTKIVCAAEFLLLLA